MTETLKKILEFFKTIQGIVISAVAVITIGSSSMLRHDAKVIKSYIDTTQITSEILHDSISIQFKEELKPIMDYMINNDQALKILQGENQALRNSHVRVLEKNLKDKEEALQYERERVKSLEEIVKKN
jgi:hypothetical protein